MKCVCPMGGDRTCPDDCLLAVWHALPLDQKTKERRRPLVGTLAKQGYTQEAIARQLDVSQQTIGRDLETLSIVDNVKGQGKDTLGRKRSTGRPKGNKKPEIVARQERIVILSDAGKSTRDIAADVGVGARMVDRVLEVEHARREPQVTRDDLSMTAQQKLDAAMRQYKRQLDLAFEQRVLAECKERMNSISLPHYAKELERMERLILSRKGVMDKTTYNKIRWCLHSDHVQDPLMKRRYDEAFIIFNNLEKLLLSEKESPTPFRTMPRTYAELMAAREKVRAERSAAARARAAGRTKVSVR